MATKKNNGTKNGKNGMKNMREFKLNLNVQKVFIALFGLIFLFTLFSAFNRGTTGNAKEKPLTSVIADIKAGKVEKVEVVDNKINVTYKDEQEAVTFKETSDSFREVLTDAGVKPGQVNVEVKDTQGSVGLFTLLGNLLPTLFFIAIAYFIYRQMKGSQDSVFSFGQSRAKRFNKDMSKTTFKDVAGVEEAKKELEEVVDFLRSPEKYHKLGARTPKGVILVGPAGSGKTLLAKAVAGEASVPFFSIAGSEFMEMLVGIGAARVRDLFAVAKKTAPAIIFIDEIDAIGRARSTGVMQSHDEREQTLNQILVEMDGFTPNEQVVVIAATNRGDLLDNALLRPGRFDRRILVDYPDVEGRKEILMIHARNKPFEENVNWDRIADRTVGFSGADLENMLNEAAIGAARNAKTKISMEDLEESATKVKLGPEKKRLQTDFDRKITAYHEAGHAIVAHYLPNTDDVHRISIVSRGMALGFTLIPPARDQLYITKTNLLERIAYALGGRAAEDVVFGEVTTGASNDFDQSTRIAKAMVMEYGMSDLGPINYGPTNDVTEWGRSYWEQNNISQEMLAKIDQESKKIIEAAYEVAVKVIKSKREVLDKVAEELIKKENLDKDEFEKIVGQKERKNPRLKKPIEI